MTTALPAAVTFSLERDVAQALRGAAQRCPSPEPEALYRDDVQDDIHAHVRAAAPRAFDELVAGIRARLARAPYTARVAGLPCDDDGLVFLAIARALGPLRARPYDPPRGQLLHRVQPSTDLPTVRAGATHETERLHTDCADWPTPARFLAMVCHRADDGGGGRSRLLDLDALHTLVATELGAQALAVLRQTDVPWQLADYMGGGVLHAPVLEGAQVRWRRYAIDAGLAASATTLAPDVERVLDALGACLASPDVGFTFALQPGELLLMDNHRTLHARTALSTHPDAAQRLMIRSWIDATTHVSATTTRAQEAESWH